MGFQGRYITWAACAVGGAILGFIITYCILGFVAGLLVLAVSLCTGAALIFFKQKKGLHTKKEDHGVFIYACITAKTKCTFSENEMYIFNSFFAS